MRILDRKLLRDLSSLRWQLLAIIAVISCGISTFVLSTSTIASLEQTRADYYATYRFAEVFCDLKRAPESVAQQFASIPAIQHYETRIDLPIRIEVPGAEKSVQGLALSIPSQSEPALNSLHLRRGRYPEPSSTNEILVSEAFSLAHSLQLGNTLQITLYGQQYRLNIVGIALSPEFIYEIAPGGLLPDNRSFGIVWIRRSAIEGSAQLDGAFNHISFLLARDASADKTISNIDDILQRYGSLGAIRRSEQRSHRFISSEMDELRNMGMVAPTIFLCVAAFLLNMVLMRMITAQREQIAALKAFGFTRWEIAMFYLKFAWITAALGALVGLSLGVYLGQGLTAMYSRFFHFPSFSFSVPLHIIVASLSISLVAATIAVANGIRRIMQLPPAEAMRPEPPVRYQQSRLESIWGYLRLGTVARMVLRHTTRHPSRSLLSWLGIALSVAILILGSFMQDAIFSLFDTMFGESKKYDLQVAFIEPQSDRAQAEIRSLPGVLETNSVRTVPVRLSHQHRERLLAIVGLDRDHRLSPLVDLEHQQIALPPAGLLMSRKLGEVLEIELGEEVQVQVLERERQRLTLPVRRFIDDAAGETIYIDRQDLSSLLGESNQISELYLRIDKTLEKELIDELERRPHVSHVVATADLKQSFLNTIAENVRRMRTINLAFSLVIAIGVIYSTARISVAERNRELATLRVMGFTLYEVTSIIVMELVLLTILAIPLGWAFGYGLAYLTVNAFDRELFRVPFVIRPATYAYAGSVAMLAMGTASWFVFRMLAKMNFVDVLKARD